MSLWSVLFICLLVYGASEYINMKTVYYFCNQEYVKMRGKNRPLFNGGKTHNLQIHHPKAKT